MKRRLVSPLLISTLGVLAGARHTVEDFFPSEHEEYDYHILDTYNVYASPYGGYGRAVRSRIAALPLYLPPIMTDADTSDHNNDEEEEQQHVYFSIRDDEGRPFVCRIYNQDELHPDSLQDSMFDTPRLKSDIDENDEQDKDNIDNTQQQQMAVAKVRNTAAKANDAARILIPEGPLSAQDYNEIIERIDTRLSELEGICAQLHKGWWSYEWCYGHKVTQFHIHVDPEYSEISIESLKKLGVFETREDVIDLSKEPINELAEDTPELVRVVDTFGNGQICEETGLPRECTVNMICCSKNVMERKRGLLHRDKVPFESDIASLIDVVESKEKICTYNVTVCTPLLCNEDDSEETAADSRDNKTALSKSKVDGSDDSVYGILNRALGDYCLQTVTNGWWTYEICHDSVVRQYHEVVTATRTKVGYPKMVKTIESEHILGYYQGTEFKSKQDEWRHIVNATSTKRQTNSVSNGSYYEVEYTNGNVCDDTDVTGAAVVAGSTDSGGVKRASTVRYYCGDTVEVKVNEDSTCHYIVEVQLPDLCEHPLFRAPVTKKQVVKCLPGDM